VTFAVERLSAHPRDAVLEALRASFDRDIDETFFTWKHVDGAWGPSDGWVAVDDEGIAGVLCCLPWALRRNGVEAVASRLVDGGTVPRAQRRGIFGELVRYEVDRCRGLPVPMSIFCTATPAARDSHVKRGAIALAPLRHGFGVLPLHRGRPGVVYDDATDRFVTEPTDVVTTAWSPPALRWRFDERSGNRYGTARLRHADADHGVVYRVGQRRGLRILFVELAWGAASEVGRLVAAVGLRHAAPVWFSAVGPGAGWARRPRSTRGESLVCSWPFSTDIEPMSELTDAALWLADVEGVI
jgi:hypothetical protein